MQRLGFERGVVAGLLACGLLYSGMSWAAHPLITEDTGTQGRGGWQLELQAEHGDDWEEGMHTDTYAYNAVLSYGVTDTIDVILSVPLERIRSEQDGSTETHRGHADPGLDLKWRFYEQGVVSFAIKAGFTYPSGDENKGFGAGRKTWSSYLVTSIAPEPWAFHLHLGYIHNANVLGEREDLWHASFGGWYEFGGKTKIVVDLGTNTNTDPEVRAKPAFAILGMIHHLRENLDLDLGYKKGISGPETDRTLMAGITLRF